MAGDTREDPVPVLLGGSARWLRRAARAALQGSREEGGLFSCETHNSPSLLPRQWKSEKDGMGQVTVT